MDLREGKHVEMPEKHESKEKKIPQTKSTDLLSLENKNLSDGIPCLNLKESNKRPHKIVRLPESSVLDRIKCFLPQMKEADESLRKRLKVAPDEVNMEHVSDDESYIEMNLSLFQYSGESESLSSDSESGTSEDESVVKNKLIEET